MAKDPSQVKPGSQVTVVTGTDFSVTAPPAPPATGASGGVGQGGTTTSTAPAVSGSAVSSSTASSSTGGAFAPPTATVTPLQPWDPRSCSASGGEGA